MQKAQFHFVAVKRRNLHTGTAAANVRAFNNTTNYSLVIMTRPMIMTMMIFNDDYNGH